MEFVAKAVGYRRASSYQRYEDPNKYKKQFLSPDLVSALRKVLVGQGTPPITDEEVRSLAGYHDQLPDTEQSLMVTIRELDVTAAAGGGSLVPDEADIGEWVFPST